ncbi:MAG TPA: DUF5317 domain-containing protein [Anaerolineae bacterium]|nr:DUF5317 domain-containing protein [Anaerolineae bacterium]
MLLLYSIAAGLLLGRLAGGRVRNLERVRFAWWQLALAGLAVQLFLFADIIQERVGAEGPVIYVLSTVAVLAALLRNVRLPGLPILATGGILNLVVILANGGYMPSSPDAWLELTGMAAIPVAHYSNVVLIGPDTLLPFLGDVFVFPRPLPMATAFSVGDAIIALGAIVFLVTAMRRPGDTSGLLSSSTPRLVPGP